MDGTKVYNVRFGDDVFTTIVTASSEAVEEWLTWVLRVHRRLLHKLVVGLDTEWRPTFTSERATTALLQLCVGRCCLIFQLIHTDYFPEELEDFLGDSDYRFVGISVDDDAEQLWDDWEMEVGNTVDLCSLAAEAMDAPDLCQAGLRAIAGAVMGGNDMEKPYWVRTGPWDTYDLSGEQIRNACINAFSSFEVVRRLLSGDY